MASIHPESEAASLLAEAGVTSVVAAGDPPTFAEAIRDAARTEGASVSHADLFGSPQGTETLLLDAVGTTVSA